MAGQTCLVTGATAGIGRVTALALAHLGANVVIVGRNPAKGTVTAIDIREETGNPAVEFLVADLSSQDQIRRKRVSADMTSSAPQFSHRHFRVQDSFLPARARCHKVTRCWHQ